MPVEHTRFARERLGSGKLVAPELACVLDTDPVRAKAVAREYAKLYLGLRNYTQNLLSFGFSEADIAHGGSDRLIDAIIPQGSASRSPRLSARTLTLAPTTFACSHSARRASRGVVDRPLEGPGRLAKQTPTRALRLFKNSRPLKTNCRRSGRTLIGGGWMKAIVLKSAVFE